jgi:hypothetical protein
MCLDILDNPLELSLTKLELVRHALQGAKELDISLLLPLFSKLLPLSWHVDEANRADLVAILEIVRVKPWKGSLDVSTQSLDKCINGDLATLLPHIQERDGYTEKFIRAIAAAFLTLPPKGESFYMCAEHTLETLVSLCEWLFDREKKDVYHDYCASCFK